MPLTTAPLLAAAILLALAGVGKLAHPRPAAIALRGAGLPGTPMLVQALALGELALGTVAALWATTVTSALLALAYGAFALFTLRLLRVHGTGGSCGCFGESSTPAHPIHVVLNAAVALLAVIGVAHPPADLVGMFTLGIAQGLSLFVAAAVTVGAAYLALTALPELLAAIRTVDDADTGSSSVGPVPLTLSSASRSSSDVARG